MAVSDEQVEEMEVLSSIFEDDIAFVKVNESCVQYKIGEDGKVKSFLVEFVWPKDYPNCAPEINLDAFYNKRLLSEVKEHILKAMNEQAESMIGDAMTYSLIDFAKENEEDLLSEQPEMVAKPVEKDLPESKKKVKKEQLTKAQKRRLADRFGVNNDRPRGWNWVDVIRHLSQTGKINETSET